MNNEALLQQFSEWQENEEFEKIIAAVLALPEDQLDAEIMYSLARAYLEIDEYKSAIAVLEGLRKTEEDTFTWNFRYAGALFITTENDSECQNDEALCENMLRRAIVHYARCMNMNPPEEKLAKASQMIEEIEARLGVFDDGEEMDEDVEIYDGDEMAALDEHIQKYFGEAPTVLHEIKSEDIHVDVYIVPPTEKRNYYTLITMGMGAREMDAPEGMENKSRCELVMCLPPNWKVGEDALEWYWPIGMLKSLAHLPIDCDTWLGWGHTIDNQSELGPNTNLCGSVLVRPEDVEDGADECILPSGDVVNFLEVIPLYREEMDFKIDNDTTELLKAMSGVSHIVDINRPNSCEDYISPTERFDSFRRHARKIPQKKLPIDQINGANHISLFLRWCIEHNLIEDNFYLQCPDFARDVKDGKVTDLRGFFLDVFEGYLELGRFSFVGANFLSYYYGGYDGRPYYPADVDDYAENYFGTERYNSEEFQDEAYLFVPFDEEYYKGMSKYIQKAFDEFITGFVDSSIEEDREKLESVCGMLKINGEMLLPEHYYYGNYVLPEGMEEAETNKALMVFSTSEECADAGSTAHLLNYALVPFFHIAAAVDIPAENPVEWAEQNFTRANDIDLGEAGELYDSVAERLGYYPMFLTCEGEPENGMSLLIPDGDKKIARFIVIESKSDEQAD